MVTAVSPVQSWPGSIKKKEKEKKRMVKINVLARLFSTWGLRENLLSLFLSSLLVVVGTPWLLAA